MMKTVTKVASLLKLLSATSVGDDLFDVTVIFHVLCLPGLKTWNMQFAFIWLISGISLSV